jgi:hypothetical protein
MVVADYAGRTDTPRSTLERKVDEIERRWPGSIVESIEDAKNAIADVAVRDACRITFRSDAWSPDRVLDVLGPMMSEVG